MKLNYELFLYIAVGAGLGLVAMALGIGAGEVLMWLATSLGFYGVFGAVICAVGAYLGYRQYFTDHTG